MINFEIMSDFLDTDFLNFLNATKLVLILFGIVFLRYILFSSACHYLLKSLFQHRLLHEKVIDGRQLKKEILYSAFTSFIFAISGWAMILLWQRGLVKIYVEWDTFAWWYWPFSVISYLLLHETYYYWLHRWMHHPGIYKRVHKVHHDSLHTSAMTSFSFHPIESILQAAIIPILTLLVPIHIYGLFLLLMIMTISGTINHIGFEMFPSWWNKHPITKWIIGATHHDLHHKKFTFNFGLYFTFWDRLMKTEHEDLARVFSNFGERDSDK